MEKKKNEKATSKPTALRAVDEILKGEDEAKVLERYEIEPETFDKLLNSPKFILQVSNRIGLSIIRSKLLIAQYAQVATAKLISMTNCEKEETARKACLDVITLATKQSDATIQKEEVSEIVNSANQPITDEQASKMLAVLAGDNGDED